jgi:hypothetical protein
MANAIFASICALLTLAIPATAGAEPDDQTQGPPVPLECIPCMRPLDGLLRIPCPAECHDLRAADKYPDCNGLRLHSLFALSFPPDMTVLEIVKRWHRTTCEAFLLPQALASKKVTLLSYGVVTYEEAQSIFLALLQSVDLALAPPHRHRRVIASAPVDDPSRSFFPRTPVEQLELRAVVMARTRPAALVDGSKRDRSQMVKLGDRIGNLAARITDIQPDRLILEAPAGTSSNAPRAAQQVILRAVPPGPNWTIGADAISGDCVGVHAGGSGRQRVIPYGSIGS